MSAPVNALEYLARPAGHPPAPVCAVFGNEPFLRREALAALRREVLGDEEGDFALTRYDGRSAQPRDVLDELGTVSLFGPGRRLVVIEEADDFVSSHRDVLEDYVEHPRDTGVLVLEVSTWPKNTRLAKALSSRGLQIECAVPKHFALARWLIAWAKQRHAARLDADAADRLIELVGQELGLLDQELAKLTAATGQGGRIAVQQVDDLTGGWRARTIWDLLDTAADGQAGAALVQLDRLLASGDHPVAVLAPMAAGLRRFAAAARIVEEAEAAGRRIALPEALKAAGVNAYGPILEKSERHLKQINRRRAVRLYRWLLEADLDLKGDSKLPGRTLLERLIVRLSSAAATAV
jgi:DNA polymerase-3 subunit delta